jgi:hypothetical protein
MDAARSSKRCQRSTGLHGVTSQKLYPLIILFTRARHVTLSWDTPIPSTTLPPQSLISIWMLSFNVGLDTVTRLVPSGFPTKTLYAFLSFPRVILVLPCNPSWFEFPNHIRWRIQIMKRLHGVTRYEMALRNSSTRQREALPPQLLFRAGFSSLHFSHHKVHAIRHGIRCRPMVKRLIYSLDEV